VGNSLVDGAGGVDTVGYEGSNDALQIDLRLSTPQATGAGTLTLSGVENLSASGGTSENVLIGNASANVLTSAGAIRGLGGSDRLSLTSRADGVLSGGAENDVLNGAEGGDRISGGPGRDQLTGYGGADRLLGQGGIDQLRAKYKSSSRPDIDRGISCGAGADSRERVTRDPEDPEPRSC
jgi:Ca2+-binding RTX toxin-like protein